MASLFILLCSNFGVHRNAIAQEQPKTIQLSEMSIGDTIPAGLPMKVMTSHSDTSAKFSDYRGKWLILDFWETYCMACIVAMPRFDSLNVQFKDQLEIVMVTKATSNVVNTFMNKSPIAGHTNFRFIVEDRLLNQIFPHRVIPHEVWVDPDGVVRAITSGEDVTAENIANMLSGKVKSLKVKHESTAYRRDRMYDGGTEDRLLFRSVLKGYDPAAPRTGWFERAASYESGDTTNSKPINYVYYSNYNAIQLYYSAYTFWKYGNSGNRNPHRIEVEIKDSTLIKQHALNKTPNEYARFPFGSPRSFPFLHYQDKDSYNAENYFCYELILPKFYDESTVFRYVFEDLNRYMPIKAKIEKRFVPCLVVQTIDKVYTRKQLESKSGKPEHIRTDESIIMKDHFISSLFNYHLLSFKSKPIIDETGIDYRIDIELDFKDSPYLERNLGMVTNMSHFDEQVFAEQMAKYGLEVKEEEREVPILVIYD